jgi:hypothetical protein
MESGTDSRTIQLPMGQTHLEHTGLFAPVATSLACRPQPARPDHGPWPRRRRTTDEGRQAVTRPPWEVADVIRRAGSRFIGRYHQSLTWAQLKVLRAIERCRAAALGGHRDECLRCGHQAISYNSCRNHHCPKCRERCLRTREQELLPVWSFYIST